MPTPTKGIEIKCPHCGDHFEITVKMRDHAKRTGRTCPYCEKDYMLEVDFEPKIRIAKLTWEKIK